MIPKNKLSIWKERKQLCLWIGKPLDDGLKKLMIKLGKTKTRLIEEALAKFLSRNRHLL